MAETRPTSIIGALQPLGRSLMLPIAVLPVAGLLLRLGQPDVFGGQPFIAAAGDAIFHNLGLLFAIGVAVGFAKDGNGAAGLAGVVCFLVATNGAKTLIAPPPELLAGLSTKLQGLVTADFRNASVFKLSVPIGILSGLIAGDFYNRFGTMKLPDYLAFFGGRRFVPIVSGLAGLALAFVFGKSWTWLDHTVDGLSRAVVAAGPLGLFAYGVLNRILIVTGLHHILNNIAWFVLGDYHGATGDLNRFFAGDPGAGAFMSGFFPVMMFGLPAACLAMYHTAKPERRKAVGGMLASLALTAFLTGVTEPIEFTFMFLAPVLFALHAILTGAAMALMDALHIKLGFSFSAGVFDYVLNFKLASRPLWLLPVGLAYFALYYGLFRFFIQRFDLKTPGREDEAVAAPVKVAAGGRGAAFVAALGGAGNLASIDACTTRLRLVVHDQGAIDEPGLKALGARGFIRPSARDLQVVVGPIADEVAREMRDSLGGLTLQAAAPVAPAQAAQPVRKLDAAPLLAALGGPSNLKAVTTCSSRLRLIVADIAAIDEAALRRLGSRGLVRPGNASLHVILGPDAEALAEALRNLVAVS
ncbi:N-acetylglucosamine-specific PTS transporter subunit IIBC [Phenylobacterium montanum]|uniref:PTS transporter subunit EIIC n=1 Tax=Phenylobacterium montanum TaxID=2823693 RepID=A0A975G0J7_9CAUL|nr:N-acetylglucosamine-specific PTS transporter subunit IIBC [Caulobacter sp. S6]QUD88564.1 PTS transporter subunit EIIC [Caulobacter sp. S6]